MKNSNLTLQAIFCAVILCASTHSAPAQMGWRQGVVSNSQLPPSAISNKKVLLGVPHIRQKKDLCVPTSSAMILAYYGERHDPTVLKAHAENYKPVSKRNRTFTYWKDMNRALKKAGHRWRIKVYPKTKQGFRSGLNDIKRSLRQGRPVMIDVHMGPGHTFVVMGFDDEKEVVYIRDPVISGSTSRVIPYDNLSKNWHNHRFGRNRSAFFSKPR